MIGINTVCIMCFALDCVDVRGLRLEQWVLLWAWLGRTPFGLVCAWTADVA